MVIDVYADVVCPWCYIGTRRLASALERRPDLEITRRWRPFQLRPEMPRQGQPWDVFMREKFGGVAQAQAAFARVTAIGAADLYAAVCDERLAAYVLRVARAIVTNVRRVSPDRYKDPSDPGDDAAPIERMIAATGRDPSWRA